MDPASEPSLRRDWRQAMIKKTAKGYVLHSKDGSRKLGGPYRTREEALKRERQVQFFKHAKRRSS
jgi:hypothetical protein